MPSEKHDVILADPPWSHYGQQDKWGAAAKFYSLMDDEALKRLDVARLAKPESVLFCWATCPRLDFAIYLVRHWGFHYRGVAFVWVKTRKDGVPIGARGVRPSIVKPTTELVIAASMKAKGRPMPLASEAIAQVVLARASAVQGRPVRPRRCRRKAYRRDS